jgi:hypothetical protein
MKMTTMTMPERQEKTVETRDKTRRWMTVGVQIGQSIQKRQMKAEQEQRPGSHHRTASRPRTAAKVPEFLQSGC